jgi:monoamine oxidase
MSKVQVRYPTHFWVENGFSGEMVDDSIGLTALDGTRPDDDMATLIGFIGGRNQDRWYAQPAEVRRAQFISLLVQAFGPDAAHPSYYHETNWPRQKWQMGAPVTYMPTGVLSTVGSALREPVGPIHFAGTEAADQWAGYMEGGVRAGQNAADQILSWLH